MSARIARRTGFTPDRSSTGVGRAFSEPFGEVLAGTGFSSFPFGSQPGVKPMAVDR